MSIRQQTLHGAPALLVAEGGARAHAVDHSLEAVRLAARLGATAVGLRVRSTADGGVVVRRQATIGLRRRRISTITADQLPPDTPSFDQLLAVIDPGVALVVTVDDDELFDQVVSLAASAELVGRLWVRHSDVAQMSAWRQRCEPVGLVLIAHGGWPRGGPERLAADLRTAGIDGIDLPGPIWTGGHVALFHRFGRTCWALDGEHEPQIAELLRIGLDAVGGPNVERLVDS